MESRVPAGLREVPLVIALAFLTFTLFLFFVGPYVWPVREWWVPTIYVPMTFALLSLGFLQASRATGQSDPQFPNRWIFYLIGVVGAVALLVPSTLIYTGSWPWEIGQALADQKEAYLSLAEQLQLTQGDRVNLALVRAIFAPFTFCVLPLAVIYWSEMRYSFKAAAIIVVFVSIDLSILRGTTREIADLVIIAGSAFLVRVGRAGVFSGLSLAQTLKRRWKVLIAFPALLLLVALILVGRTEARMGGHNVLCVPQAAVCLSASEPYASMSDTVLFGFATVQSYLSQGYYGLSLAAEKDFETTFGLGHSPALTALYTQISGDEQFSNRSYTARGISDGWSDATQWSTLLTWIANDVGFWGAAIFIWLLGLTWGRTWANATQRADDKSAVLFCAMMMIIFYLPANNQMMATFDGYATLLFWGAACLFRRKRTAVVYQLGLGVRNCAK